MNPRIKAEIDAYNNLQTQVRSIVESNPDGLSAELETEVQTIQERALTHYEAANKLAEESERQTRLDNIAAGYFASDVQTRTVEMTAGEFFSAWAAADQGDSHAAMQLRDLAQTSLSDTPGLLPQPIVGQLLKIADDSRKVWSSFTTGSMPAKGRKFSVPVVTQRVNVAEQAAEFDEVATRDFKVDFDEVSKHTLAGALEVSKQDIDWSEPSVLQAIVADFVGMYARVSDQKAATYISTAHGASASWNGSSVANIIGSVLDGLGAYEAETEADPNTLWLSTDQVRAIAKVTNTTTDQSAMSLLNDALREAGYDLTIVSSRRLASSTRLIGDRSLIKAYEASNELLQAFRLPNLKYEIGYAGYFAFWHEPEAFLKLV